MYTFKYTFILKVFARATVHSKNAVSFMAFPALFFQKPLIIGQFIIRSTFISH